ncbi:MAG: hypothetical protein OXT65_01650 [Alphaproteobacteria bacterium]|nr:hypothetical protein [Alphaproteobacteria bacterium]
MLRNMLAAARDYFAKTLTIYDLFAMTIVVMVLGHTVALFELDAWLRMPDRILVPVFMIGFGYNVGRPLDKKLLASAVIILLARWLFFRETLAPVAFFPMSILAGFVLVRLTLEKMMPFMLKGKAHFWGMNALLLALLQYSHEWGWEYGTLCYILAIAGWLCRNEHEVPEDVVRVKEYFFFGYVLFLIVNQGLFTFSPAQFCVYAAGSAGVFAVMYNLRTFVLNAVRRKRPKDRVARFVRFLGHNSIEVYVAHTLFFYAFHAWNLML